ncbi:hypothetical protein GGTG_13737 [Gaeumannomyces tritici R3-111a-1]|uniref:Uncharacterized protein n=1 Tax=Gaeumannomyces tritici (strain R3-111a-1) TaxID=644352 RepID=J3PJP8_GAET3|nr:hypothetical protein GGTG_13737 [Gaeumannomyces tritici R3-111a-1]EJT68698.1 hypothetical protein GGTG_13737 [Gaeumannomyces tritici R3-111a-1]
MAEYGCYQVNVGEDESRYPAMSRSTKPSPRTGSLGGSTARSAEMHGASGSRASAAREGCVMLLVLCAAASCLLDLVGLLQGLPLAWVLVNSRRWLPRESQGQARCNPRPGFNTHGPGVAAGLWHAPAGSA